MSPNPYDVYKVCVGIEWWGFGVMATQISAEEIAVANRELAERRHRKFSGGLWRCSTPGF